MRTVGKINLAINNKSYWCSQDRHLRHHPFYHQSFLWFCCRRHSTSFWWNDKPVWLWSTISWSYTFFEWGSYPPKEYLLYSIPWSRSTRPCRIVTLRGISWSYSHTFVTLSQQLHIRLWLARTLLESWLLRPLDPFDQEGYLRRRLLLRFVPLVVSSSFI